MTEHTQEPWSVGAENCGGGRNIEANGTRIAHTAEDRRHNNDAQRISEETAYANARRIVACVNACRSLPTGLLERLNRNGVDGIHPHPQERIEALTAQRDSLLAALERLSLAAARREHTMGDPCSLIVVKAELADANKQAREAIAATQPA